MPFLTIKSWRRTTHSLSSLIGIVFDYSTKPEMGRIYARRAIPRRSTIVKDAFAFWNLPEMNKPTGAMRFDHPRKSKAPRDLAVAFSIFRASPEPAMIGFVNKFPEPLYEVFRKPVRRQNRIGMRKAFASNALAPEMSAFRMVLHKSDSLICATLRTVSAVSGHFHFQESVFAGQGV